MRTKKEALVRARYIPYVTVVIDHARVARDGAAPAPATFGTTEEAYLAELADPALALELIANNLPITGVHIQPRRVTLPEHRPSSERQLRA